MMKTILVTGSAGFIGSNLVLRLLSEARACSHSEESKQASLSSRSNAAFKELSEGSIVGLDNLNDFPTPCRSLIPTVLWKLGKRA